MWAFMTTGTAHFLKKLTDSHPAIDFFFMKRAASTLVFYEGTKKKGVFVSGRSYQVLKSFGSLHKKGFVVMDHVPVTEDGMDVFEEKVKKQLPSLQHVTGLTAIRFIKQLKGNMYVIITQWETERDYADWQKSSSYEQFNFSKTARLPAYFADRPFTSSYYMMKED